jgi:hypothetical protein
VNSDPNHDTRPSRLVKAGFGRRISGSLLCAAFVLTAAACPGQASKYADDVARAAAGAETKLRQPQSWLFEGKKATDETSELSRLLANPPDGVAGDPKVREAVEQARAVEQAAVQTDQLLVPVQATSTTFTEDAANAVAANAYVRSVPDEQEVAEAGKTVLRDIVCSLALDRVAPEEKNALAGQQLNFSQLSDTSDQAVTKELLSRAAMRIGQQFSAGFRWGYYAAELTSSANRHLASISRQVETPNWTLTGEYVFVVHRCLAPPR